VKNQHNDREDAMSTQTTIGGKIRAAREKIGTSQADLARAVDVTPPHLWQVEHGRAQPSLPLIRRLAEALGVEPGELI